MKRIIAIMITIAVILQPSMLYCKNVVKAQETANNSQDSVSVEVLGATIKINNDATTGTQSLRFGIKVNNASKARHCGMDITAKKAGGTTGKTITISTEKEEHCKIYSKNPEKDFIVYTVIVKDIPVNTDSDTTFTFKGFAKSLEGGETTTETIWSQESDAKSLNSVLDTIGKSMNLNLDFYNDGRIVELINQLQVKSDFKTANIFKKEDGSFLIGNDNCAGQEYCTYYNDEEGEYYKVNLAGYSNDGNDNKGIGYKFKNAKPDDYIFSAKIRVPSDKILRLIHTWNRYDFSVANPDRLAGTGSWQDVNMTANTSGNFSYYFVSGDHTGNVWTSSSEEYDIKDFKIYRVLSEGDFNDLVIPSEFSLDFGLNFDESGKEVSGTVNGVIKPVVSKSATMELNDSNLNVTFSSQWQNIRMYLPENIINGSKYTEAVISYTSSSDLSYSIYDQTAVRGANNGIHNYQGKLPAAPDGGTLSLTAGKDGIQYIRGIEIYSHLTEGPQSITIHSVTFSDGSAYGFNADKTVYNMPVTTDYIKETNSGSKTIFTETAEGLQIDIPQDGKWNAEIEFNLPEDIAGKYSIKKAVIEYDVLKGTFNSGMAFKFNDYDTYYTKSNDGTISTVTMKDMDLCQIWGTKNMFNENGNYEILFPRTASLYLDNSCTEQTSVPLSKLYKMRTFIIFDGENGTRTEDKSLLIKSIKFEIDPNAVNQ